MAPHLSSYRLRIFWLLCLDVTRSFQAYQAYHSREFGLGRFLIPFHHKHSNLKRIPVSHLTAALKSFAWLLTVDFREMVSVPFHQIMRSTSPVFTVLIYRFAYSRTYSRNTYLSLIPVVLGVGLATYGDYYFTVLGFNLTVLGVLLSSLKTIVSNRLMTGSLALPALEILLRMSPLAAIQSLGYAIGTGEASAFLAWVRSGHLTPEYGLALAGNGFLAFLLNVSSFYSNKLAGALTVTVCANLKQCLTVLLGILFFDVHVGIWNGVGMVVTLLGAAMYSKVELDSRG